MKIYVGGNSKEVCCVTVGGKVSRSPIDGENTNNVAVYRAILFGLYKHPEATEVYSNSLLVLRQLEGSYAVKSEKLLPYWLRVKTRIERLGHDVKFTWVPKENNLAGKELG